MKYLRLKDIKTNYTLSKSSVYDLTKKAGFPKPIKIGSRTTVYSREEIDNWFLAKQNQGANHE